MIRLRNINKSFGDLHVLRDISLDIAPGEIIAIVGASGAGKTTLLQVAGSLLAPDSGSVDYDGTEITGMNDKALSAFRNRHIGFVFQFHQLLSEFSAVENVAIPAMIGGMGKSEAQRKGAELLDMLGLGDRLKQKITTLSGGERQRVAIARALINEPAVIFADEPTGSLDSRNRDEIRALMARLNRERGQSFVIVTHDPSVSEIAHRVVTMADGRITSVVKTEDIADNDPDNTRDNEGEPEMSA